MLESRPIAIVDDDEAVRESVRFLLDILGYTATPFASARRFLAAAKDARFAGAILDHHMPELTGLEVAQRLRAAGNGLPLMLLSGALTSEIAARAATLAIAEVVAKPISDQRLLAFAARVSAGPGLAGL